MKLTLPALTPFVLATLLGISTASFLSAQSDDDSPDTDQVFELEDFEVQAGFSGSLAASTEVKMRAPVIVEAVSAEDIGKLPDTSIAETLSRLPGLTTQRINSRAQGIVIRGLVGDFSTGLLNGRQQVSTAAGRSIEFDQYPAELLNGVVVYKTGDASLIGQGLAGTIDMHTVRPLKHGKRTVAVNAFYEWTSLGKLNPDSDDTGLRYSANYIDQFNDGTLGIAIGYSSVSQPGQGEQWNAWGYPTDLGPAFLGGAKPFVRSSLLERDSYMGVLEFKPSDKFHATLDVFYSDFSETQILRGIEMPLFPNWGTGTTIVPGYTVDDGLITNATVTGFYGVMRNDLVWRDADVTAVGLNVRFGDEEGWHVVADASYSGIDRKDNVLETYSGFGENKGSGENASWSTPDTVTYDLSGGTGAKFTTALDYTDGSQIRLASPQGWGGDVVPGGQVGFYKGPQAEDELSQYKVFVRKYFNGFISAFEGGAAYTDRTKFEYEAGPGGTEGYFLALRNGATSAPLPPSIGVTNLGFIGIPGMYSYNARKAWNTNNSWKTPDDWNGIYEGIPNENPAYRANNWDVAEKVTTAYVQFGLEGHLGSIPFTGSIGSQLIHTDQSANGLAVQGSTATDVTGGTDYIDFVPSLNLIFKLTDHRNLRFSLSRQLARQAMVDMRAGSTYSFNETLAGSTDVQNSPWSGSGGNPELEPWRSNSLDLSLENYFPDNMGYWAISAFYKDLVSYTYNEQILSDFTGYPTGVQGVTPAIYEGYRSVPANGEGGSIKGLEATLSLPGEKLADALNGFGVIVSASFTRSSIQPDRGNPSQPIPGLSEQVVNGTLYYEKSGFAARVSARYRSDYRGDIATFGPRGAVFRNLQAETVIDAQVSYSFADDSMLKGLTLILQGYNLTDEPLFATQGDQDNRLVQDYQRYGTQYSIGASYKF